MPVLRINATETRLLMHGSDGQVADALATTASGSGPIVIMIHGFKYAPYDPVHCPHQSIFGDGENGWPQKLGFAGHAANEGLCIAFAWYSRSPLWQAHRRAMKLGHQLADLIQQLRMRAPDRPVHLMAHSLGSEIALSSLAYLPARSVDRILLLTGASFTGKAAEMLSTPAGLTSEVFNVTSRENDLFDVAFEHIVARTTPDDRAVGQGIAAPNALNLQLDCDATLDALAFLGLPIDRPQRRICHWSAYTRPGVMDLYTSLLRNAGDLSIDRLSELLPQVPAPRWSRFAAPSTAQVLQSFTMPLLPLALRLKNRIMASNSTQGKNNEHAY